MPILQIEMIKGRTVEQKRELVKQVTNAVSQTLNCPKDAVSIIIREMEVDNFAKAGILWSDSK
ncbi:MAG TPA: 4-oxalocrotonate tautomerase [Atribacterota bacterium]|mgnify:FL=1|nr:4-oxalocrotonate tautomerase [Atribacterota bacterium]HOR41692.1 4-oxalocrotonate tautomerase [Atribacterota bacterium]HPK87689.1 4-oxalocrotonate tautomerase [Atribacterota bacterium]